MSCRIVPQSEESPALGLCLCFKDSAEYLPEWLSFHFVQGFRKFYLYDNGSLDNWWAVVRPWVAAGLVETFSYPGTGVQQEIYNDCLRRASGAVSWLAFLDDDEFLFPANGRPLVDVLREYESYAGVAVSWILYGSGGEERRMEDWVIDRFTLSSGVADNNVKCIVRPERIATSILIGHQFKPVTGYSIVDENRYPFAGPVTSRPSATKLRINHYLVKSWEEWQRRRSRPQAHTGLMTPHPKELWQEWDKTWSTIRDRSACEFTPRMKEALAAISGNEAELICGSSGEVGR